MSKTFTLWAATKITAQQDTIAKTGVKLLDMIRQNQHQCLAHFKEHGDITLAERLLASLPPGMVVAGIAKWFKDFAPVKFDAKGKATVTGDPSTTKLEEAMAKDWTDDQQVRDRATRPITKPTIAFFKARITGFVKQVDRYNESAPADEKMSDEEVKTVKMWIASVSEFGNKVTVMAEPAKNAAVKAADSKGQSRASVRQAKASKLQSEAAA